MIFADLPALVIAVLLISPVEIPVPQKAPEPLWQALKQVALKLQIVGPHERWGSEFRNELRYVRHNCRDLTNAPPWDDCLHLPPLNVAADCCSYNLANQQYVNNQRRIYPHRWCEYSACLQEARQLYLIWHTVHQAADTSNSWAIQRRSLRQLQCLLGPGGELPPAAPIWRFDWIETTPLASYPR